MYACQFHECKNEYEKDKLRYVKFQSPVGTKCTAQNKRDGGLPIVGITKVSNKTRLYKPVRTERIFASTNIPLEAEGVVGRWLRSVSNLVFSGSDMKHLLA